ncbi:helix-turn-helix domain-containing protein [Marinibacterium sp. SX1]|uniref:helix-turn-helix domain-containing protein n=1 Tax=Marinibacterium sp. SX1 TaxID=3388424 RepID=UPI003D185E98
MFGANLRLLSQDYPSIAELSRRLGINRTQFNRYLSGESFPRPDILARICAFFDLDARILLEPVDALRQPNDILTGHELGSFVGAGALDVPEDEFPSGFYRFTRRSFVNDAQFVIGLVYVYRQDRATYVRGYEAKDALRHQGIPVDQRSREFRGFVTRQEDGIASVMSRRHAMTCSFNYLSRIASFENNFWVGYVTRTVRESVTGRRAVRMVYEHIEANTGAVLAAARATGYIDQDKVLPFHLRLLQPDAEFR